MTGGSGRLGTELQTLLPELLAPSSAACDVTSFESVRNFLQQTRPDVLLHAAAYTDLVGAERERERCWSVNVEGTRNVARACREAGVRLVHISTDYVFSGEKGNYHEEDMPGPVDNFYSLSKLLAEEAARAAPRALVVRTSFRPRKFQHPVAFDDVYTSQDYVDVIAPMLVMLLQNIDRVNDEILHVATERKSVYELAKRRSPTVQKGSKDSLSLQLPADVSLNTERWRALQSRFSS